MPLFIFANQELQRMAIFNGCILCGQIKTTVMISQMMKKLNCRGIVHFGVKDELGSLRKILQSDILIIETKGDSRNENESQVLHMAYLY